MKATPPSGSINLTRSGSYQRKAEAMDKKKGKQIDEDRPSRKILKGGSSTSIQVDENEETEVFDSWDWRHPGVLGPVLDQGFQATCWAIPLVRALQALLNIGVCSQQQVELSIQHIINNLKFCSSKGISNIKTALHFIKSSGVCVESQCRHRGEFVKRKCAHQEVHCHKVDSFTHLTEIEDADLEEMVRRQPIAALMPYTDNLLDYDINGTNWIYRHDRTQNQPLDEMHHVLIVGYGDYNGRPYWIIQNSWGVGWGDLGYAYVHRQTVRGRSLSQFAAVFCPNRRGYPRHPGPKDRA